MTKAHAQLRAAAHEGGTFERTARLEGRGAMGKKGTHIGVERAMVKSAAFGKLTGAAPQVLLIFMTKRISGEVKRKKYIFTNLKNLTFTYREADDKYSISHARFVRAIDQLVRYGFLDIEHPGAGVKGDATVYALPERWRKYGTANFEEAARPKEGRALGFQSKEVNEASRDRICEDRREQKQHEKTHADPHEKTHAVTAEQ